MKVDHTPVLLSEVLDFLKVKSGGRYIDATVGAGGHASAICKSGGEVLALDQDPVSIQIAKDKLEKTCPTNHRLVVGNFSKISSIAKANGFPQVDGILLDLGFASFQMEDPSRGLSISRDGPLDMRLDPTLGVTAADLVNSLPQKELEHLFYEFGDEPKSHVFARKIVEARKVKPFETTRELAELMEHANWTNRTNWSNSKVHPATRVFMALRIAINSELENLQSAIPQSFELLKPGGRLLIISFHSGEDRIVKNAFKNMENSGVARIITKKPITPTEHERNENPRARSAKLRVLERTIHD